MIASLGNIVAVEPIKEHSQHIEFEIKRKIKTGILKSKGDAVTTLEVGDKVYYLGGKHLFFDGIFLMNQKSIQGYERV